MPKLGTHQHYHYCNTQNISYSGKCTTAGAIQNSSGYLSGQFSIAGNVDAPSVNGQLSFENAATTINYLKTRYFIPQHSIHISEKGIDFGLLTLKDANQNKAKLSGNISYHNFENIQLNLQFKTQQFRFLNYVNTILNTKIMIT